MLGLAGNEGAAAAVVVVAAADEDEAVVGIAEVVPPTAARSHGLGGEAISAFELNHRGDTMR